MNRRTFLGALASASLFGQQNSAIADEIASAYNNLRPYRTMISLDAFKRTIRTLEQQTCSGVKIHAKGDILPIHRTKHFDSDYALKQGEVLLCKPSSVLLRPFYDLTGEEIAAQAIKHIPYFVFCNRLYSKRSCTPIEIGGTTCDGGSVLLSLRSPEDLRIMPVIIAHETTHAADHELHLPTLDLERRATLAEIPTFERLKEVALQHNQIDDMIYFQQQQSNSLERLKTALYLGRFGSTLSSAYPETFIHSGTLLNSTITAEQLMQTTAALKGTVQLDREFVDAATVATVWLTQSRQEAVAQLYSMVNSPKRSPLSLNALIALSTISCGKLLLRYTSATGRIPDVSVDAKNEEYLFSLKNRVSTPYGSLPPATDLW